MYAQTSLQLCGDLLVWNQRNGVTTARLKGMQQDLHINGTVDDVMVLVLLIST